MKAKFRRLLAQLWCGFKGHGWLLDKGQAHRDHFLCTCHFCGATKAEYRHR